MKQILKIMQQYAHSRGEDMNGVFCEVLEYLIGVFSIERYIDCKGYYPEILRRAEADNPALFPILIKWIETSEEGINKEGCYDFFGKLYEECFTSKTKSSAMGQFFTPMPLCQAMAECLNKDGNVINDPACGSGRTVLAHWAKADKSKLRIYRCEDLDPMSVKMCALNMMINGMYGTVICHDSLQPNDFKFGYAINEVRYPIPTPAYSIRNLTSSTDFNYGKKNRDNLLGNAK